MQITSDRDRVPRARCSRRKKEGGEDGSGEECSDERCSGRRRDELNGGKEGGKGRSESGDDDVQKRDRARACTQRAYVCTRGGRLAPIVIAIPTGEMFLQCAVSCRPATKPERGLILLFALVPATEQQVAQPSTCPLVCRPPYMPYIYTLAAHGRVHSLYERSTEAEKERYRERGKREKRR